MIGSYYDFVLYDHIAYLLILYLVSKEVFDL